jgi:plastocyanin
MRITVLRIATLGALSGMLWLLAGPDEAAAGSLTVHVADQTNAAIVDAVVYAIPTTSLPKKAPAPAEISQVDRAFTPIVTVVQTGASVSFPNRDSVRHQVYSFSPAKTFELKLYAGVPAAPIVFDKPGLVAIGCNIHDGMVAYVMVVDTPYFSKTIAGGDARIVDLPPGEYKVSVWHPKMPVETPLRVINVGSGDVRITESVQLKS